MHSQGLIHKDIKPANILATIADGEAWLTGFGLCSRVPRERQVRHVPEVIASSLAYMAPEQTGRMNRSIDSRSDLYSCGVTLFQMLTGRLPFDVAGAMEWVHCHIARQPPPPSQFRPSTPAPLDAIVMKLLAKTAEDRYQTAGGLEADLRYCLKGWKEQGRIDPDFVPGVHDKSDRIIIPEKLYGRRAEIAALAEAFEQVTRDGAVTFALIAGYSGMGKSSIVQELHKVLLPPRGAFAAGKFDQYKRDVPYASLAQAFRRLVRELIDSSDHEIGRWRNDFIRALGISAKLLVDLVPELETIIGPQPPVPDLPSEDAQNRLHRVFDQFIGVFARPERPLVLFLDDLQWLDLATLAFLEHIATTSSVGHLLVVGAYRDTELPSTHPLPRTLRAIGKAGKNVLEISLSALNQEDLTELVADAFHTAKDLVRPLAALVYEKTGGNPFFSIQFVAALVDDGLVWFDTAVQAWHWNLERIGARGLAENVIELLARKIERLSDETQSALSRFACLGSETRRILLSASCGVTEIELDRALEPAIHAGLIRSDEGRLTFIHDRIREAAYSLIPHRQHDATHLHIARSMMSRLDRRTVDEHVFDIANQFNRGAALIGDCDERQQAAELNIAAGRRAKASTAYASALSYFTVGRDLLDNGRWQRHRDLSFALEFDLAACGFLTGLMAEAEDRLCKLAPRVQSLAEKATITELRATISSAQDNNERAIELVLEFMRGIGVEWSAHPGRAEVMREYGEMRRLLGNRSIEALIDMTYAADADWRAVASTLATAVPAALLTDEDLTALLLCKITNLTLEHGNCEASSIAYALLGSIFGPYFGDARTGFRLGGLAVEMIEKPELGRYRARVITVHAFRVNPWNRHIRTSLPLGRRAFDSALEAGDLTWAGYICTAFISVLLAAGRPLHEIEEETERSFAFAQRTKFGIVIDWLTGQRQLVRCLRGSTSDLSSFDDNDFSEAEFEAHLEANPGLAMAACWYWVRKLQGSFLAEDYKAAASSADKAASLMWTSMSFFEHAEYHFYAALTRAARYEDTRPELRVEFMQAIDSHCRQLELWAQDCPENFIDRATLIRAEIARIEGREIEAMRLYEQALASARKSGFLHTEAVAYEAAARFYLSRGFDVIGRAHIHGAILNYRRWGAEGKVRRLQATYSHLVDELDRPYATPIAGTPLEHLDVATVVRTAQAVSGQNSLERLLRTLMVIVLEHAGAERGLLILRRGHRFNIEARADVVRDSVMVRVHQLPLTPDNIPDSVFRHVVRTHETVLLDDAQAPNSFSSDGYFVCGNCRSVLCIPLLRQRDLIGVLHLENSLTPHVFTPSRIALLEVLASQAALSLESATLEEKDALLKEVHHRVKNNLQLICSLLNLQAARISDPAIVEQLADSRNRVRSMALVHENLYQAGNFSKIQMASHVQSLCAHLSRAYGAAEHGAELLVEVGDFYLDMNQAVACGLIINELVSNALKHAFPNGRTGRVKIGLRSLDDRRRVLLVSDNGVGLPPDLDLKNVDSLGLQLFHDLADQLRGDISVSRDAGTTFTITFDESGAGQGDP
ncbi:MAG TPA: AAA family ATPase [Bradyrhizobium sp.]|nr:AAA family ATPase [Bradyrhizobium sp.]